MAATKPRALLDELASVLVVGVFFGGAMFLNGFIILAALYHFVLPWYLFFPLMALYGHHVFVQCPERRIGAMEWEAWRDWQGWGTFSDYFSIKESYILDEDASFSGDKIYIFGHHPHGVFVYGMGLWMV